VTFDSPNLRGGTPKQNMEQVSEVTEWVTTFKKAVIHYIKRRVLQQL